MGLFRKKADPLSARARLLNAELARLQAEIDALSAHAPPRASQPRLRSTALPHGAHVQHHPATPLAGPHPAEPIFEEVEHRRVIAADPPPPNGALYNDLGVRKFDLVGVWRKVHNQFRGPAPSNPKLVTYLVAGHVKGLRALRYERRVARNRFLGFSLVLLFVLWGLLAFFFQNR
jgi:hypothetical protein